MTAAAEARIQFIDELKRRLLEGPPHINLIIDAMALMLLYPREALPDWVEILANGSIMHLPAVCMVAKEDIAAEGLQNDISVTA